VKYYIASKFKRRSFLREVRKGLTFLGHTVTSTWIDEELDFNELTLSQKRHIAVRDKKEILRSTALLLDCMEPLSEGSGGGREYEAGFAEGIGVCVVRIGPAYSPFHNDIDTQFRNWDHFIEYIQKEGEQKDGRRKKG